DPLLLQAMWLALALAVGLAAQAMVVWFAETLRPDETQVVVDQARQQLDQRLSLANIIGDLPLFIYTLFGGWFVRLVMTRIGILDRIDAATIGRLSAAAMDLLVVAAITTLNLKAVAALLLPFSIIFVCGCLWAMLCLCILAPRILPRRYWFPLALINYGMSTGTTATGFVLLRVIDPKLRSGAAEDYALAAPLTAPFIGGGMITVALPLLLLERVPIAVPSLVLSVVVAALVIVAMRIARNSE
ncbi:MAG: sodium:glutamate symporter, partial [Planctomycetota bacterium]